MSLCCARSSRNSVAVGAEDGSATPASWDVEPWGRAGRDQGVAAGLSDQVRKYMVLREEALTTVVLWTAMSWVHDAIATHSPYLVATSAEPDSGKTTLLGVLVQPGAEALDGRGADRRQYLSPR